MLYPNKIEIIIIVELFFKIDISILDVCLLFLPPITSSSMCHELTIRSSGCMIASGDFGVSLHIRWPDPLTVTSPV